MVQRALPFCGSSKTSGHNFVFLEGVNAALQADAAFKIDYYTEQPTRGLRAVGRVYAGLGFSQAFYSDRCYETMGHSARLGVDLNYSSLEDFLVGCWEGHFLGQRDANDLLTQLWTWRPGDVSTTPCDVGDTVKALQSIKAKLLALPAKKDLYFCP
ncbi:hypothetical protein [Arthrobacter livingstonensis]|uniref:hypothetical protein n=1 Tax=Arthrobacter livingstonensis TaxID=670078 RepID=UPI001B87C003|nr:hypothetical protein [Arthrobacter livingstonensis]